MTAPKAIDPLEVYPTPAWAVHRILERILLPWNGRWFDPCAGECAIKKAAHQFVNFDVKKFGVQRIDWTLTDVRAGLDARVKEANYLQSDDQNRRFDVAMFNPPFSLAVAFASRASEHCTHVVMLQRLNWLGSEERSEWVRANTPDTYVLPNRCSFTGNGKTDSQEYAWFHWHPALRANGAKIRILASTSAEERKVLG